MNPTNLSPELAGKVLEADHHNLVKKVGQGGTLTAGERQLVMGLAAADAKPGDLVKARVNALLKKWLDGGRLSRAEREEIATEIPEASFIIAGPAEEDKQPLTEKEVMERYELSRATFFRWKNHGASVAEGADPPPWQDATALVAWYERMRGRGVFKHRCPSAIVAAARAPTKQPAAQQPPASVSEQKQTQDPPSQTSVPPPAAPPGKQGFLAELESLQEHTATLRETFQRLEREGEVDKAKLIKAEYFDTLETLRKYEKDKEQIATASGELVRKADVQRDLDERMPSIVANLEYMIDRVDPQLQSAPDRNTRRKIWRTALSECFKSLRGSKYAPPLALVST